MTVTKPRYSAAAYMESVAAGLRALDHHAIERFADLLLEARNEGRRVIVFGNGGSAANASHFAGDLVKGLSHGQDRRFKAICLSDNVASMMAYANDVSYEAVFVEPLKNFVEPGDLVIGVSGSGNSMNVVHALAYAKEVGATTVALCGFDGGKIKDMVDLAIHAAVDNMEMVEDLHLAVFHCVKTLMMQELGATGGC